ncbi:MAG TPA: hypothetical protein VFZ59_05495 [Verrucomicrobiae bacterium]|nr:hypothetical protein [Verrucomicrobiae bacterium]
MKRLENRLLVLAAMVVFSVVGFLAWREHKAAVAYRQLAIIVSSVTNVTVYDLSASTDGVSSNSLSLAVSAPFPIEVFSRAAGNAAYRDPIFAIWKGSSVAVLTLRDGATRLARFSYYGGFFSLEGVPGYYVVPGGHDSEFHTRFWKLIDEQFATERRLRKKTPAQSLQP